MPSAVDCSSLVGNMGTTCCCNGLMVLSVALQDVHKGRMPLIPYPEGPACASMVWTCQAQLLTFTSFCCSCCTKLYTARCRRLLH